MPIKIEVVTCDVALLPKQATSGSAGADVCAYCPDGPITVRQNEIVPIPTGLKIKIPKNYGLFILPRSGRSKKHERIANSPGLLDSDYRGELMILLHNMSPDPIMFYHGDRVAQIVLMHTPEMEFVNTSYLSKDDDNERGEGGFGSTGESVLI